MHKLMCTFMTPMKKKIPDRNLDTSCPAGIPCNEVHQSIYHEKVLPDALRTIQRALGKMGKISHQPHSFGA